MLAKYNLHRLNILSFDKFLFGVFAHILIKYRFSVKENPNALNISGYQKNILKPNQKDIDKEKVQVFLFQPNYGIGSFSFPCILKSF